MGAVDFSIFRCIQTEGLQIAYGETLDFNCKQIHEILELYRNERFQDALVLFDALPPATRNTFSGLDIEIALTLKTQNFNRTERAIDTISLFILMASTEHRRLISRLVYLSYREFEIPWHIALSASIYGAHSPFAQASRKTICYSRHVAERPNGKLEASQTMLSRATESWPKTLDSRPLDLLEKAIKQSQSI